jgi:hypothetical protein
MYNAYELNEILGAVAPPYRSKKKQDKKHGGRLAAHAHGSKMKKKIWQASRFRKKMAGPTLGMSYLAIMAA